MLPSLADLTIEHTDHSQDPGAEVLDLPHDLGLTADEARSWLDVPAHVMTPDLARLTGHASDYQWAFWLADVLRKAGCSVVEHPGWKTRGRPRSVGPFTPRGVIWHHDASRIGPSPAMARFIAQEGRPAEGIPAPLAQTWICIGCEGAHPVGTWHVLAAGRSNHAGIGAGFRMIPEDMGTTLTIGVEMDNTTGERTPAAMYDSAVRGTAGILKHLRSNPAGWLAGHKEFAAGRKIDPDDIAMGDARRDVAARMVDHGPIVVHPHPNPSGLIPFPGVHHFTPGNDCRHGFVRLLEQWLRAVGLGPIVPGPRFDGHVRGLVQTFQRRHPALAGDADGIPGPLTWRTLQLDARSKGND